jgi:hypothetical protein
VHPPPIRLFLDFCDWSREVWGVDVRDQVLADLASRDSGFEATLSCGEHLAPDAFGSQAIGETCPRMSRMSSLPTPGMSAGVTPEFPQSQQRMTPATTGQYEAVVRAQVTSPVSCGSLATSATRW